MIAETILLRLLSAPRPSTARRYAVSTLIVVLAAAIRYALDGALDGFPVLLFYPAVFLCGLLYDRGAGIFATILSAILAAHLFIAPRFSLWIEAEDAIALGLFVLVGFAMAAMTEALRRTIARLDESERAKALLLLELAHRTKNDLAIISSAIQLQSRAASNPDVRQALDAANARVLVVARAQERLRGVDAGGRVDLSDYIATLCRGLDELLGDVRPITVRVACDPIEVPGSMAISIGLIVNELVTNSLKYAYPGERGGVVEVAITRTGSEMVITVSDDGVGCPEGAQPGLGSKLVRLFAQQMRGSVSQDAVDRGFRTRVTLGDAGF
ncbi:sensor histidine kinase [Sphingomonas sp. NPDC019816]|uniref:sensor histidine kinase n=1 Tax=Sphingomonas sp. NPDC019816 TaxID=3390679 RepID=UPI003D027E57